MNLHISKSRALHSSNHTKFTMLLMLIINSSSFVYNVIDEKWNATHPPTFLGNKPITFQLKKWLGRRKVTNIILNLISPALILIRTLLILRTPPDNGYTNDGERFCFINREQGKVAVFKKRRVQRRHRKGKTQKSTWEYWIPIHLLSLSSCERRESNS